MLTFEQIKELIELIAERRLQSLEIERSDFRLKIDGQSLAPRAAAVGEPAVAAGALPLAVAGSSSPAAVEPAVPAGPPPGSHVLTSPIVGTFYRSPSPQAPAFVEIGARVRRGQVMCIVEAMKLMNEIESDVDGVVLEIYPQNAQPVEYGEPLFAIRVD